MASVKKKFNLMSPHQFHPHGIIRQQVTPGPQLLVPGILVKLNQTDDFLELFRFMQ
jgi:hypothetical protein